MKEIMFKQADEASDFESAFSQLVHGKLEDSVPSMLQYLVGFQTLEAEEDKGRSVGIAGFKIKKQWLYVPCFFLNGQIKGADMIYARTANLFAPLNDNWVGYLMSKDPGELGVKDEKSESQLHILSPDFLTAYTAAGMGRKSASEDTNLVKIAKEALSATCDLRYWCNRVPHFGIVLAKTASENPEFKAALSIYYKLEELMPTTKQASAALEKARDLTETTVKERPSFKKWAKEVDYNAERKLGGVVKVSSENVDMFSRELTDYQKSRIFAGDVTYVDTRRTPNIAFNPVKIAKMLDSTEKSPGYPGKESSPISTLSPFEPAMYNVMLANGAFKELYVVPHMRALASYQYSSGKQNRSNGASIVFDCDAGQARMVMPDKFVCLAAESGEQGLKKDNCYSYGKELSSMKPGHFYSLVFPNGDMSNIFQACASKKGEAATTYQVRHSGHVYVPSSAQDDDMEHATWDRDIMRFKGAQPRYGETKSYSYSDSFPIQSGGKTFYIDNVVKEWDDSGDLCVIVQRNDSNSDLVVRGSMAVVGSQVKCVEAGVETYSHGGNFPPLGSRSAMWNLAFNPDNTEPLEIKKASGAKTIITTYNGVRKSGSVEDTLDRLVLEVGLQEKQARDILGCLDTEGTQKLMVTKVAKRDNDDEEDDIGAPWPTSFPSVFSDLVGRNAQEPQEFDVKVPGAASQMRLDYPYSIFEDSEVRNVLDAANSGEKDVFDVKTLKGLIKSVDISDIIDEYLPDLIKGMDRLGRLRFIMLWHIDKLKERFGEQDLVDLEEHLKSNFEELGDTILFLQKKAKDADPVRLSMNDGKLDFS